MRTPKVPDAKVNPRRGEIWRADLEPAIGKEMKSRKTSASDTRPVLVLSLPGLGERGVRLAAPLTDYLPDRDALLFWRVEIGDNAGSGLTKMSCVDLSQTRALDLSRFKRKDGQAHPTELSVSAATLAQLVGANAPEEEGQPKRA